MLVCLQQYTISWRTFSGNVSGESFLDWYVNILGVARGFHECLSEAAPGWDSSQWTWLSCDFPVVVRLYSKAELRALIFPLVSRVTEHLFTSPLISKGSFNNGESVTGPVTWASTSLSLPACSFPHLSSCVPGHEAPYFHGLFFFLPFLFFF